MSRQLALIDFAIGSLRRRLGKSVALVVGLAFVVALFGSALAMTDALHAEHARAASALPDLTIQRLIAGRPALIDETLAGRVAALPAVRRVEPRVWGYVYFLALEANVTVAGVGRPSALAAAMQAGRPPRADGEVAVGSELARGLGLRVGDELALPVDGEIVLSRVVGLFGDASAIRSADLVVTTPAHARALLGVPPGYATDFAVSLTTMDAAEVITEHVGAIVPGARVLDRRLLERTYELTYDGRGGLLAFLLLPALAAFLLLSWERLTSLGDAERREIGVLKAIGWSTGDVLAARAWESVLIGVTGASLGAAAAYVNVFVLGAPGLYDALLGWSTLYPPLELAPSLEPDALAALLGAVVVPFVAVGLVPAWRAAMIDPDRAMRGEP